MPADIHRERDNVYRLDIRGMLRKAELDRCQEVLLAELARNGDQTARLLVVLDDFTGWHSESEWSDLNFFAEHGRKIERIAIVGDPRWRDYALMFAAADLRTAPVEFFAPDAAVSAREWLSR